MARTRKYVKRENGGGSVYFRKDIKVRPWYVTAPAKYEMVDGKWRARRMVIGSYATREEAKEALEAYNRAPSDLFNITVREIVEPWLEKVQKEKSKSAFGSYRSAWKKCIELADMKARDLKTAHMQKIIEDNKGMSKSTLDNIRIVLGVVCSFAAKNDLALKDYAEFLELPRKAKEKKEAFNSLEVERIKRAVGVVPWADVIYFMIYTGWRITELLTLTRFSWDSKNGVLTGGIKTDAGKNRIVPVHQEVRPILEKWIAKGGETIFCREDGRRWDSGPWRKRCYYKALESIDGVRRLPPHACRRTAITRAAAAKMRPEEMVAMFGHTDYKIEVESYIDPEAETLVKAIQKMG